MRGRFSKVSAESWRERMGVEPTKESFAPPLNGFEDRGAHQDSITPQLFIWTRRAWSPRQGTVHTRNVLISVIC